MPPAAKEPVISCVRRMNTSPIAPTGRRPISEATNGAAAPEARSAATKPTRGAVEAAIGAGWPHRRAAGNDSLPGEWSAILGSVIAYRFGREDLLHTRFAISPLFELQASVAALRDPGAHSVHLPWVRAARQRLAGFDFAMLDALLPDRGYAPDFFAPPPRSPLPDIAAELERVRATEPAQVRRELGWRFGGDVPAVVRALVDEPARGVAALVDEMAGYWERALAPWWEPVRELLEADIRHRAGRLAEGGAIELFAGLHSGVRWRRDRLEVEAPADAEVELAGRGLQLVPSAFVSPRVGAMFDPPWQPSVIYAPRGV